MIAVDISISSRAFGMFVNVSPLLMEYGQAHFNASLTQARLILGRWKSITIDR